MLEYGAPGCRNAGALAPSPDGPAVARLPPSWYAKSRVIGYPIAADQNTAFKAWEDKSERYLAEMTPAWQAYGHVARAGNGAKDGLRHRHRAKAAGNSNSPTPQPPRRPPTRPPGGRSNCR